jgi:hypothetical protein
MPTDNEREENERYLADEFLQHELMNEARAYIERGRRLQTLSNDEIVNTWVATFERWFGEKTAGNSRDMDDAAAEIRLRGLEMPYERVKNETHALQAELERLDPEDPSSPEIDRKIGDFLEARSKPKN